MSNLHIKSIFVNHSLMRKLAFSTVLLFLFSIGKSQLLSWTPSFPTESTSSFVITMDATKGNQGLNNYGNTSDVYIHTGVITSASTSSSDWRYVKFNQNFNTPNASLQAVYLGANRWQFTINGGIRAYYGVPAGETILKIALLFRNGAGSAVQRNLDGSDMYIPISTSALDTRVTVPFKQPTYNPKPEPIVKAVGNNVAITGVCNLASTMNIYFNGTQVQTASNVTSISSSPGPVITTGGTQTIVVEAINGPTIARDTVKFFVPVPVNVAALPAGVRDGINYGPNGTSATLVLYAPGKSRVCVIGDLPGSNWDETATYQMNKTPDGNYWWININGLTPGTEYSFQYLINGNLAVTDPYVEKVLDPWNDRYITAATYPNLKPYPTGYTTGIVGILQTNASSYNWTVPNFVHPDKKKIVIYELLMRDFTANHNWATMIDTISYLKNLGINAIELMPVNEFEGNNSWGYNPDFYFAVDKNYGTSNDFKTFIDRCHANGIAVVMDIALNHSFGLSPMVQMYWDTVNSRPAANNPWFNPVAKHAFNVGYDFNHESLATRYFTSRVLEHWLVNYKIDGFRFDLSKGFTQNQTCDNNGNNCSVGGWSAYDASRINIWKRYYDTMQLKSPGSIPILEHFSDNAEETELSNYGFLLWGNMNNNYSQASMGYSSNSDLSYGLSVNRGWSNPHLITYMESHDEERVNFKNIMYGNSFNGYNVRDTNTAPKRLELAHAIMLTQPGPKMIWQFGELGYDTSINACQTGPNNNNCRTDPKPLRWGYFNDPERRNLYNVIGNLNRLRTNSVYNVLFSSNNIYYNLGGLIKYQILSLNGVGVVAMGNFDVATQSFPITFPYTGTWYNYLNPGSSNNFSATGGSQTITLQPGEYRVYTNQFVSLCNLNFSLNSGADTIRTCSTPYTLTAPSGYASYSWSGGSTNQSISVNSTGWYRCTVTSGSCNATDSVYVNFATGTPAVTAINGSVTPCVGNALSYTATVAAPSLTQSSSVGVRWTLPVGASITSANSDSSTITITYNAGFNGGTLSAAAKNSCGTLGTAYSITLKYLTPTPTAIISRTGNFNPCIGDTITYTVSIPAPTATQSTPANFRWTRPANTTVLQANVDSSSIQIRFDGGFAGGTISVAAVSSCGLVSTAVSTNLVFYLPPTPTAIIPRTGNFSPCVGDTITYTVTSPTPTATQGTPVRFRWTKPAGTTILLANADSSSIKIRYDAGFAGGTLSVAGVISCGAAGNTYTANLLLFLPPTPTAITPRTGNFSPCIGDTITYTVTSPTPTASQATPVRFRWTKPAGATILLSNTDSSSIQIRYDASFNGGILSVSGVTSCGIAGTAYSTNLLFYLPPTPTGITARTGNFNPCIGDTITYNVISPTPNPTQATPVRFRWTKPAGASILLSNADSSSIQIQYEAAFAGGTISVAGVNSCGIAGMTYTTTVYYLPPTPVSINSRSGNFNACIDDTISYTVVVPAPTGSERVASVYRWSLPANTSINNAAADSSRIQVKFLTGYTGGNISVAGQTTCGIIGTEKIQVLTSTGCSSGPSVPFTIVIMPNPTRSSFHLKTDTGSALPIQVRVMDILGRVYKKMTLIPGQTVAFGEDLPSGTYLVQALQGDKTKTMKVVKY